MALCCRDLFQLKHFSKARLLAGKSGLNREISLPYVRNTESISKWLYGRELLFVTYESSKKESDDLLLLLEECIDKNLSGVVILIDDKDIENIPKKMIDRADEERLPLFIMPWDIKLIDIIQEIFLKIEEKREESKNAKHFLESILFSQDQAYEDINTLAEFYNINLRPYHFICIFKVKEFNNISYESENVSKSILTSLEEMLSIKDHTIIPMQYANHLMVLVLADNSEEIKNSLKATEAVFNIMNSRYSNVEVNLSFSRIRDTYSEIKTSYKEAFKALSLIDIYSKETSVIKYNELGIVKLFVELNDIKEIQQYCYENLGPILEYDKSHGMNLIGTLKCYFENNRHLVKTSQALFIHRNTLLYRLATIKELIQKDLDDAMNNLELFNSILIYEFLNLQNKK
ncbi:PucR family transcriptional regulator ligand-binding domain-containing protein [Clostridium chauvoei]|uniref:PucR family transcriptional regulator ligand-binding domain-containing protein n=2 Tax=Clostridium chauvoei TaxID=46867 RepID=A0ABD4RFZ8_9CLOT|nr:PucR family transcriptional regulator ligand-binding domain-containing protein [Clostridium chauvoei]ATD56252.1 PucR family transcriptional regulator [Clostridium chauvoei]ATD58651.1 PucR family transcriptional regulator [Clostridium chauvoei]MBX7280199.1 PucR family transcriptional regulator ligand-binding domain-containing protein [Clostridium chauvoei]MBX7282691.1 PucR family transcriptional regulator ligand-binding domain-containing protein [Clostridium chauvoei]MBX7285090.1 PucR family